jgi:ABC-type antimicrobial peptide transport system permease subunit
MIKNYLKTGIRILSRNKSFSIINIIGFAVGLTTTLMIFLFIKHETSFDQHLSKKDNLYRVVWEEYKDKGVEYERGTPAPLAEALKNNLFNPSDVVRVVVNNGNNIKADKKHYVGRGIVFTGSGFCNMFDVNFIHGNAAALDDPGNALITEQLANKYFGEKNPLGEEIVIDKHLNLTVKGIIQAPPAKTHMPYEMLVSDKSLSTKVVGLQYDNWGTNLSMFGTYVLAEEEDLDNLGKQITRIYKKNYEEGEFEKHKFYLQSIKDIHLDSRFGSFDGAYTTSKKFIWIFLSVGILILLIALINFINLSVVQAIRRTREVGLRKVIGATRMNLVYQFFSETVIIILIAEILSLVLVEMLLPALNDQLGPMINLELYGKTDTILFLVSILIVVSVSAGIVPSLFMSKRRPIEALRNKLQVGKKKSIPAYKVLVIFQFFVTQLLLISLLVINKQIDFMKNKDLGFNKEHLISVDLPRTDTTGFETFKQELAKYPSISDVTVSIGSPISRSSITSSFRIPGDDRRHYSSIKFTDLDYLETFDIPLIAGEWFRRKTKEPEELVVNKSFMKDLGIQNPDSILGKSVNLFGEDLIIIGVTEDFHHKSLHDKIEPLAFCYLPGFFFTSSIKLAESNYSDAIPRIKNAYKQAYPESIFDYRIYGDFLESEYNNEERTFKILRTFSFIAIILAAMGLFGLVSFIMVQKTKEIGIRKAVGATSSKIVFMYVWRYIKIVLFASLFALPAAWYLMKNWLMDYAYHIKLSPVFFIVGLVLLLGVALLSIMFQTIRTANTNPAKSLRDE